MNDDHRTQTIVNALMQNRVTLNRSRDERVPLIRAARFIGLSHTEIGRLLKLSPSYVAALAGSGAWCEALFRGDRCGRNTKHSGAHVGALTKVEWEIREGA